MSSMFPFVERLVRAGDLVFFSSSGNKNGRNRSTTEEKESIRGAVISSSTIDSTIFHVGLITGVLNDGEIKVVHASNDGVKQESLSAILAHLKPALVEVAGLNVDSVWKDEATKWAIQQIGAKYNDIFSPELVNSKGERSFYCCQLVNEAYKATAKNPTGKSPFLPHTLNFQDSEGKLLPFWVELYKKLCPDNSRVPHGDPGTHPSKLRVSPDVELTYSKALFYEDEEEDMRKFHIPCDLTKALHFVNGTRVNLLSSALGSFQVMEPRSGLSSGEVLSECPSTDQKQIEEIASIAKNEQKLWAKIPWVRRRKILIRAGSLIRMHLEDLAHWEVRNNGKSITEAKADILQCADTFDFFSALPLAGEHLPYAESDGRFAYTKREPFGVVGGIGAWNFPFQTATWKICPAIACGNAVVYKPSPLAPITPVLLAMLLQCAGVPYGVVNIVQGEADTGQALCESQLIKKVSFTGSLQTGKKVQAYCTSPNVKPVTLELGGKSSVIILEDADLDMAVNGALLANFLTQGEVCTNASKVIVHRKLLDSFTKEFVKRMENLLIGDPLNENTNVGSIISMNHMEKIQNFIQSALDEGAKLLSGGERVVVKGLEYGFYLSPCILTNISSKMKVYREEIFGPVALIIPFDTDEEALEIANDTEFGLAAGIFTNNLNKGHNFASRLEAGTVFVNTYNDAEVCVPFGGFNQSGYARENGRAAIESYTQLKSIYVNVSGKLENPFS